MRQGGIISALALLVVGCSTPAPAGHDAAADMAPLDAAAPDLAVPDIRPDSLPDRRTYHDPHGHVDKFPCNLSMLDKPCTKQSDCGGSDERCLKVAGEAKGYCTCLCTPDNRGTPLINEDTCPGATTQQTSVCRGIKVGSGKRTNVCVRSCKPRLGASDCQPGRSCQPLSLVLTQNYSLPLCLGAACTADKECRVLTGSICSKQLPCPAAETCLPAVPGMPHGACARAGKCDTNSGLCAPHGHGKVTAKVGDPCKSDLDCAGEMSCDSRGGAGRYCVTRGCACAKTLTHAACKAGALCNPLYPGGLCQKACDLTKAQTCRGHKADKLGDLECRAWNNVVQFKGGPSITSAPVCDFGSSAPCVNFKNTGYDCSLLGLKPSNPTAMACRDLSGKLLKDKFDTKGYCLDSTASGPATP